MRNRVDVTCPFTRRWILLVVSLVPTHTRSRRRPLLLMTPTSQVQLWPYLSDRRNYFRGIITFYSLLEKKVLDPVTWQGKKVPVVWREIHEWPPERLDEDLGGRIDDFSFLSLLNIFYSYTLRPFEVYGTMFIERRVVCDVDSFKTMKS